MSRAHETPKHPFPASPGAPSADLADRAADGFARFMAGWQDDPDQVPDHDIAADRPGPERAPVERFVRRPYRERAARYQVASDRMATGGLNDRHSVADIGAGHTELDVCLRTQHGWRGRYVAVDRWTGDVDLEWWKPPMRFDWLACLEVIEHLQDPDRLLSVLLDSADLGVVITTPNPAVVDVLAMDPTHKTPVSREHLARLGFYTSLHNFYGTAEDGICGTWYREGLDVVERQVTPVRYEGSGR